MGLAPSGCPRFARISRSCEVPVPIFSILDHTAGIVGFYGASSMERLPVEPAIRDRVREFTELKFKGK